MGKLGLHFRSTFARSNSPSKTMVFSIELSVILNKVIEIMMVIRGSFQNHLAQSFSPSRCVSNWILHAMSWKVCKIKRIGSASPYRVNWFDLNVTLSGRKKEPWKNHAKSFLQLPLFKVSLSWWIEDAWWSPSNTNSRFDFNLGGHRGLKHKRHISDI